MGLPCRKTVYPSFPDDILIKVFEKVLLYARLEWIASHGYSVFLAREYGAVQPRHGDFFLQMAKRLLRFFNER